ncbi:MAG: corrinoid protein [Archaeoglobi archaeon]|nr:corrinoid protein [Candidatus Mnemosynella bozhongmuii]
MSEEICEKLKELVVELDMESLKEELQKALEKGIDPFKAIDCLAEGMKKVGELYEKRIYFVPELIVAGEMMKEAVSILEPLLKEKASGDEARGEPVVIGTVSGDLHDIGKNLLISLLEASGFRVYDLGVDVPPEEFVKKIKETGAKVLGLSSLLTSTLEEIKNVVKALEDAGIRDKVKIIIGGAATTPEFAKEAGVDAQTTDAIEGVEIIKRLVREMS